MADLPRHLGIHSGGLVLTARPLVELTPIERARMDGRTVIGWDKDDAAAMGLVKIDLLALGMLSLLGRCLRAIKQTRGVDLDLGRLQPDDAAVFDLLQRADTVGVFQVESRAQMNLAPRLKPRTFYDLVISVALIRPGPILGDSVHPYLRRRAGVEPVSYPHPLAAPILERTLGVPLFQEQGMRLSMQVAGFTPGEADALRRAMGSKRSSAAMRALEAGFFRGAAERGVERTAAEEVWRKLAAFASYGFAESHAASFALLAYQSAYLKHYYPEAYACAYLNSLPMGFWPIDTIVGDARRRGIPILPPDVQASSYDWALEERPGGAWALRAGLRAVKGVGEEHAARLDEARAAGPYRDLDDFRRRTGLAGEALANLGACGVFAGLGLDRRAGLWAALAARPPDGALPGALPPGATPALPPMTPAEALVEDYRVLGFSPLGHLMTLRRAAAARRGARRLAELATLPDGVTARVAGRVAVAQSPPSAHGMAFVTLEDETGLGDLTLRPPEAARHRATLTESALVLAEGRVQRAEGVASLLVRSVTPLADAPGAHGRR
jgi:error-prone DNA polymerase